MIEGKKYEGKWHEGKIFGGGDYTSPSVSRYKGVLSVAQIRSLGIFTYYERFKYNGERKDGKRHGKGSQTFTNGEKYEGEWKYD